MKRCILCLAVFMQGLIYGQLSDHLKKTDGKKECSKMRNIDFIYMINLDQRPEKFAKSSAALNPYGIYPHRFSAVNGWELPNSTLSDVGLKYKEGMPSVVVNWYPLEGGERVYGPIEEARGGCFYDMSPGAVAICLSHISVLQDAWDSGYETIWVMEDDVVCEKDPRILSKLIDKLDAVVGKENWDVLCTDRNSKDPNGVPVPAYGAAVRPDMDCSFEERYSEKYTIHKVINHHFARISARFGAYSMIIRRSGIKKLLDFSKEHAIHLPYDLDNYLAPDLKRYGLRYDVVTNDIEALTDNGKPNYLKNRVD